jgi:hypothetical protein
MAATRPGAQHAVARALEQLHPERLLERREPAAHRRRVQPEPRLAEVSGSPGTEADIGSAFGRQQPDRCDQATRGHVLEVLRDLV